MPNSSDNDAAAATESKNPKTWRYYARHVMQVTIFLVHASVAIYVLFLMYNRKTNCGHLRLHYRELYKHAAYLPNVQFNAYGGNDTPQIDSNGGIWIKGKDNKKQRFRRHRHYPFVWGVNMSDPMKHASYYGHSSAFLDLLNVQRCVDDSTLVLEAENDETTNDAQAQGLKIMAHPPSSRACALSGLFETVETSPHPMRSMVLGSSNSIMYLILIFEWISASFALYYLDVFPTSWDRNFGRTLTLSLSLAWNLTLAFITPFHVFYEKDQWNIPLNNLAVGTISLLWAAVAHLLYSLPMGRAEDDDITHETREGAKTPDVNDESSSIIGQLQPNGEPNGEPNRQANATNEPAMENNAFVRAMKHHLFRRQQQQRRMMQQQQQDFAMVNDAPRQMRRKRIGSFLNDSKTSSSVDYNNIDVPEENVPLFCHSNNNTISPVSLGIHYQDDWLETRRIKKLQNRYSVTELRYVEYSITAPILMLGVLSTIALNAPIWSMQVAYLGMMVTNLLGIPLHQCIVLCVRAATVYDEKRNNRWLLSHFFWAAVLFFIGSWLSFAATWVVYLHSLGNFWTNYPGFVKALVVLLPIFYLSFGVAASVAYGYILRLCYNHVDAVQVTDAPKGDRVPIVTTWHLTGLNLAFDVLSIIVKVGAALIVLSSDQFGPGGGDC